MVRHKCAICGRKFELKRYLTKHEIRMHQNPKKLEDGEEESKNLKCSMCDKEFSRLSHLQRHQMTHLNVRNFACEFCDEKFVQKSHLTRHVARKHASASKCEISWTACDKCGKLFKTMYEMKKHRETAHIRATCRKCGENVEGNIGMYRHHMKCRNESNVCEHCSATFARLADLRAHETSCLKKVAFVCVPCDEYFKQRVQLDRHISNRHYVPLKCTVCEHTSQNPVENARHSLECRKSTICGYCNIVDPQDGHVAEQHWRRLKKAVKVKTARKEAERKRDKMREKNTVEEKEQEEMETGEQFDDDVADQYRDEEGPSTSATEPFHSAQFDDFSDNFDYTTSSVFEDPEDFLTFSICPKVGDLKFEMAGKLPAELVELFPMLEGTSIVLLQSTNIPVRFTVQVPVFIPKNFGKMGEEEEKMRKWIGQTVFVE